jgi:hypothetical protein
VSKTFLILVLIFGVNVAFASKGFVQDNKNTSATICTADAETAYNQDGNDIDLDATTSLYFQDIPYFVNLNSTLAIPSSALLSPALITIRGPPFHYQ